MITGKVCCGLQLLSPEWTISEGWDRSCTIPMALDDRCRAPVLVCCNIFQPTSCRHAARVCTGGVVFSLPCMMRCMTGVRFLCMDVLRCHGIFSRTFSQGKNQYFKAGFRLETVLSPVPGYDLPGRRIQREKCSVDTPSAGLSRLPGGECLAVPRIAAGPTL